MLEGGSDVGEGGEVREGKSGVGDEEGKGGGVEGVSGIVN